MVKGEKPPQQESAGLHFQSKELEGLLNIIDDLRSQGISRYVDLPQLIVCGDQSSGKSSVLEAVSGIKFPTKDNLCTRFPTELVLRRNPNTTSAVTIVPEISRSEEEKKKLSDFQAEFDELQDFDSVVAEAGLAMGLDDNTKIFSNDVLRVELTGPKLPHLTLVDLPGLFHSGNRSQSEQDADAVKTLVKGYMAKPRSIILAVVSAKNDYANQIVTKYAKAVDKLGERTLGIITKPDTLDAGSESEKQFLKLADNKDVVLRLGWHVLKNRDFKDRHCSGAERDQNEKDFFSESVWASLNPSQLGIVSLKPRLSRVLRDQITTELPGLLKDVKAGIKDCEGRLERLGTSRATKEEQRGHLHQVMYECHRIIMLALQGQYDDRYFQKGDPEKTFEKRIRAVVVDLLDRFSQKMATKGHQYKIVESDASSEQNSPPFEILREDRLKRVGDLLRESRGLELPGFFKHEIITALVREQCAPWQKLVRRYANRIFEAVRVGILDILDDVADITTKEGILRVIIDPALEDIKCGLDAQVNINLHHHIDGRPITFNHYFTDNLQKLRTEREAAHIRAHLETYFGPIAQQTMHSQPIDLDNLAQTLATKTESDMQRFACSEALDYMEAYYKVALKFCIDDFSIHTIEECLMARLESIFNAGNILTLDDNIIQEIAGETEESIAERRSSTKKLGVLNQALKVLHRLNLSSKSSSHF